MNNTLIKGLCLLEVLAHSDRPLRLTELAARLSIGKSNVHRMLQALLELRYVEQDDSSAYRASIRLWELGSAVLAHFDVKQVAAPFMEQLLADTRETVHLSVLDGDDVVYVHKIDSPEPVRAYSQIGGRAQAHCVATGKAMLAFEEPSRLEVRAMNLTRHSDRTIVVAPDFLREMERVRALGYAVNRGEWRERVHGVAAPIRDGAGRVVAAIGISGPAERVKASLFKPLAVKVIAAAQGITQALDGNRGPADTIGTLMAGMRRGARATV